tara:strand:- start:286 stop:1332 length:1047 start_codon:yes stop_codon:yes gene_type:complete
MKILNIFKKKKLPLFDPYVIAEAGVNHECNMKNALQLIKEAKKGGAHAIKFQTYKADELASKYSPSYWDLKKEKTKNQNQLFKKYDKFNESDYKRLKKYCDKIKIEFLSTPFDFNSAKFLSKLVKCFKISSSDITNKPFIKYLCKFKKPIILSTGASNLNEIKRAVNWIEEENVKVAILHCILNYPTKDINANLNMITSLNKNFPKNIIGYSDHTLPKDMITLFTSTLLGAKIIEKHFTLNKRLKGNDHYHSMDIRDLSKFTTNLNRLRKIIGNSKKKIISTELISKKNARRSIVINKDLKKGEKIKLSDLSYKRPGTGLPPFEFKKVLNKKLRKNIYKDQLLTFKYF